MKRNNFALWVAALGSSLFAIAAMASDSTQKAPPLTPVAAISSQDINAIARDVYLYAYPIVSMDVTMRQATNVLNTGMINMRAPVNQFAHARAFPRADEKDVVRFNFDTLYSLAWLDLAPEPMVLTVPDTGGRYYLLEMLDMWSDVFSVVGSRTTGTKAGNFAIVAPGWIGTLPEGVGKIVAPTPAVWILGRTQTNGPADYSNVHQIQDGYRLTPLSQWGRDYTPPQDVPADPSVDTKTPPQTQVNRMNGVAMLTRLAELFSKYPPHANDYPILFRMRALGLEPGKPFDPGKLDPALAATINAAAKQALDGLAPAMRKMGKLVNGWNILTENVGTYGTSYKQRAVIALGGLGANLPEDAVYPTAFVDAKGAPLSGANKYVLHFDKGKLPPANAFWSITMYDQDGFQVPNPINRFAIGDRDKLAFNADGSLDIYVQAESPSKDKISNWLPAPKNAPFQPTLRIYSPRPEVADGTWAPPPFRRMHREGMLHSRGITLAATSKPNERRTPCGKEIDMTNNCARIVGMIAAAALLFAAPCAWAREAESVSSEEARQIAREAYIYAYPLVLMDVTRRVNTNVAKVTGLRGPMNEIAHGRAFPDPSLTDVVRPNADTLYSAMYFDVFREPMVFSVPDSGGRYYLLPMLDMWTDVFAAPGKRTTGTGAQTFAVTGPGWQGQLPPDVDEIKSPRRWLC